MRDASAILKRPLEGPTREPDTEKASAVVGSVVRGRLETLPPVHWLADVASVAARRMPQTAVRDVEMLAALPLPTTDDPNVSRRAMNLAIATDRHLLDTAYHAVTLEHDDAMPVTADARCYPKVQRYGTIAALRSVEGDRRSSTGSRT